MTDHHGHAPGPARDVLVTGGSGFIGRVVVGLLRDRGDRVTVADLRPHPDPAVPTVVGDLRDPAVLAQAARHGSGGVVHLAAVTSVVDSAQRPVETYEVNVGVTFALAEQLHLAGATVPLVFASTNAAVGAGADADGVMREDSPMRPLTAYGATKAAAECLLAAYAASYGLPVSVVRLSNVYGPGMADIKDSFVARLLRAARDGLPVTVFGDGKQTRDFLYVGDAAAAMVRALDEAPLGVVNVGSGTATSVNELLGRIGEVTGVALDVRHEAARAGEVPAASPDVRRAEGLGLRAATPLAAGLQAAWDDTRAR